MSNTNKTRAAIVATLLAMSAGGCAKDEDTARVSGNVTIDGQLLERGTVAFHPVGGSGKIAYGQIQPDGSYSLRVGRGPGGLPPGEYRVMVTARMDPLHGISEGGGPPDPGARLTPARYAASKETPLKETVTEGDNVINITLEWTDEDRAAAEAAAAAAEKKVAAARATAGDQPDVGSEKEADEDAEAGGEADPETDADVDSAADPDEGGEGETGVDDSPDAGEASEDEKPASEDPAEKPGDESNANADAKSTDNGNPSSEGEGS